MTIQDLIDYAKKNNLPLTTEVKIESYNAVEIDGIYIDRDVIMLEAYGL